MDVMDQSAQYVIELPPELAQEVHRLGGMSAALQRNGIANREAAANFQLGDEAGKKSIETVIVAAAAAAPLIAAAVSKIITTISRRPVIVDEEVPVPLLTADGQQVRTPDGRPVFHLRRAVKIVEPTPVSTKMDLKVDVPTVIKVTYKGE
jgi:hypothetical protein